MNSGAIAPEDDVRKDTTRSQEDTGTSSVGGKYGVDADLEALLQENSEVSSTDRDSSEEEIQHLSKKRHVKRIRPSDHPESTIAILVLACWAIRVPAVYMDFIA